MQSYSSSQWGVQLTTGVPFAAGETYEIKVVVANNQMTVYVDGFSVGTASGPATYTATGAAVYVGSPWYDAARVTLSHICLKEYVTPKPTQVPVHKSHRRESSTHCLICAQADADAQADA